jgi:hypothetical protein
MVSLPLLATAFGALFATQDTVVVSADNPPVWGAAPRLIEEVRIGALDGDEVYTLGDVSDVAVSPDGTIWAADRQARAIRRYDRDGRSIGSTGRSGEGPGEFNSIAGLERLSDGRFAAWDPVLLRFSLFSEDGEFEKTIGVRTPIILLRNRDGFRVDDQSRLHILSAEIFPEATDRPKVQLIWIRVDTTGVVLDTIPVPAPQTDGPSAGSKSYEFGTMAPFSIVTRSALSPKGYLVLGRNSTYALHHPLPDGRIQRIERSWSPVSVGREERAEFQALGDASRRGRRDLVETSTSVPRTKPPFWGLWVDQEGRVWVARHTQARAVPETESEREVRLEGNRLRGVDRPPSEWWEPLVFDVIEPGGRYLGTVTLENHRTELSEARGTEIWVIEQGEFDEQYVVRYRVATG